MTMMKIAALGLALGLLAAGCAGTGGGSTASQANIPTADVSGAWTGTFSGSGLNLPLVLTLQQTGDKVTGNIDGMRTYGGDIEGVVKGNQFSWRARGGPGGGELIVNGNEMTGTAKAHYGDGKVVLRRRQ